jgi:hypothetical protein
MAAAWMRTTATDHAKAKQATPANMEYNGMAKNQNPLVELVSRKITRTMQNAKPTTPTTKERRAILRGAPSVKGSLYDRRNDRSSHRGTHTRRSHAKSIAKNLRE